MDDLRAMGVNSAAIEAYRSERDDFEVWPENWPAVQVFVKSSTQWYSDFGQKTGLNLPGVESVARALSIPFDADLLDALQVMEAATLKELARRAELRQEVKSHRKR